MTLKKLLFKPGVNRENTRYTSEEGWYDSDKIRFRAGTPEKIGGWNQISASTFIGVCRSLWNWVSLGGANYMGVGTNSKFYVELGGAYYDVTPLQTSQTDSTLNNAFTTTATSTTVSVNATGINLATGDMVDISGVATAVDGIPAAQFNTRHTVTRVDANNFTITVTTPATSGASGVGGSFNITYIRYYTVLTNPFATISGSSVVTVTDSSHGQTTGNYVVIEGPYTLNGLTINGEYVLTVVNANSYTITVSGTASSTGSGGGTVTLGYEIPVGPEIQVPVTGWSAGTWGAGTWGNGSQGQLPLRLWSQANFGEDLVFGPRDGGLYYWDSSTTVNNKALKVADLAGASDAPVVQSIVFVSDVSRFVMCMGVNPLGSSTLDPMLVRWSDQESVADWTPTATNQAGDLRLSRGSEIISALQVRQEVLVWTDSALYSLQYVGAPITWTATLLGDNTSIISPNATAVASGVTFWMGVDKFYMYDGRVQTLDCKLRQHVFSDINLNQALQVFAGTNEGFNEVWWFYCSTNSTVVDKYVIYNYVENVWYYGTMGRTAWIDSGLRDFPVAATYSHNLVNHESGVDDNETGAPAAINAYIESAEFDLDDGDKFGFVYRLLPDITFRGSTAAAPQVTFTMYPMTNSGSGYGQSIGGSESAPVTRSVSVPVEEFTGQIYTRVRGRQMVLRVGSNQLGTTWQLGAPRMDIRPDGRR
jgi:hypothetical protein